jgi:NAD(P)H-dependent FMN reductase
MEKQPEHESRRVTGISGSIRKGSYTRMAMALALRPKKQARRRNRLILATTGSSFARAKKTRANSRRTFANCARRCAGAGIMVVTPEYQAAIAGC